MKLLGIQFGRKPIKSLGDGLSRVKAKWGAEGKDLSTVPGELLYRKADGNVVAMATPNDTGNLLVIKSFFAPNTSIKDIIGKLGTLFRERARYIDVHRLDTDTYGVQKLKKVNEKFDFNNFSDKTVSQILNLLRKKDPGLQTVDQIMVAAGDAERKTIRRKYKASDFLPYHRIPEIYYPNNRVKLEK